MEIDCAGEPPPSGYTAQFTFGAGEPVGAAPEAPGVQWGREPSAVDRHPRSGERPKRPPDPGRIGALSDDRRGGGSALRRRRRALGPHGSAGEDALLGGSGGPPCDRIELAGGCARSADRRCRPLRRRQLRAARVRAPRASASHRIELPSLSRSDPPAASGASRAGSGSLAGQGRFARSAHDAGPLDHEGEGASLIVAGHHPSLAESAGRHR